MEIRRLAPREREVAEIVRAMGEATAADVERVVRDPLSNSAIRSMLNRLQAKGVLRRRKEGKRFFYAPVAKCEAEREAALRRVSRDYFGGSLSATASALLDLVHTERPWTGPRRGKGFRIPGAAGRDASTAMRSR